MTMPEPHSTHEVTNQPAARVGVDEFEANLPLVEGVRRHDAAWALDDLSAIGRHVGTAEFQHAADLAHRYPPVLHTHDRQGNRVDEIEYHPAYHEVIASAVEHGAHTSAWAHPRAGANVARAAAFMLFAQVEPGHACPISMTHAVVPALRQQPELADVWLPRVFGRGYDGRLVDAANKPGALFGMAMTEKQGGSDVRANRTVAMRTADGYLITGHKWFCSAPMSDAFLVLAQTPEGIGCFLVPRVLDGGSRNVFRIQRLKNKLGNRSNASCEVEFDGTVGHLVGEPGAGIRTIIEMVARTRLDCVLGSAAGMRQSVAEAAWHVRGRAAFGRLLVDQPAMRSVVADLALESEAATATALRLARAHDDDASHEEVAFRRLATAVSKYWVCKRGPAHAAEALECLGGNGYTEDFPLAMRYREQPVMAVWEGSGNVIALDTLRALAAPGVFEAFDAEVSQAGGVHREFDTHLRLVREEVRTLAEQEPDDAATDARRITEDLALVLQASLLLRYAPAAVSDAFVASRLGDDRRWQYGALPTGSDLSGILARA
ncbi:acyl-CoA dehydrogenase family protein [Rathayibacter sp. KR2-224]|uniref:acyl-CoA dehydrogenase family protein n=1 Tax=Rathayibacter sp. KR2-224 TaxID=3400913 RepID=UPI003C05A876